jgi:acyl carrier protein
MSLILDRIIAVTKDNLGHDDVTANSTFIDLGMDSLDIIDLLWDLEEEFSLKEQISLGDARPDMTIQELADRVTLEVDTSTPR